MFHNHSAKVTRQQFILEYLQRSKLPTSAARTHGFYHAGVVRFCVPSEAGQGWQIVTPEEYLDRLEYGLPVD